MNYNDLQKIEIEFRFNQNSKNLLRDAEIALEIIKNTKTKILSKQFGVSTTTVLNAHKKVCRRMFFSMNQSNKFENEFLRDINRCQFKCPEGIILAKKYKEFVEQKIKENPQLHWIDKPEELKEINEIISKRLSTIIERLEKRRISQIERANKEFESIKNQLYKLLTEISLI